MSFVTLLNFVFLPIGVGAVLIGMFAIVSPEKAAKMFGVEAQGKALPYVMATGARDLFIGLVVLVVWYDSDHRLICLTSFSIAVVSFADFLITRKHGSKMSSLFHLASTIGILVYGALMCLY